MRKGGRSDSLTPELPALGRRVRVYVDGQPMFVVVPDRAPTRTLEARPVRGGLFEDRWTERAGSRGRSVLFASYRRQSRDLGQRGSLDQAEQPSSPGAAWKRETPAQRVPWPAEDRATLPLRVAFARTERQPPAPHPHGNRLPAQLYAIEDLRVPTRRPRKQDMAPQRRARAVYHETVILLRPVFPHRGAQDVALGAPSSATARMAVHSN